jgi:hypothetical protein
MDFKLAGMFYHDLGEQGQKYGTGFILLWIHENTNQ